MPICARRQEKCCPITALAGKTKAGSTAAATGKGAPAQNSGVLGSTASAKSSSAGAQGSGELPFTGFPIWIAVAIAAALVVFGLALLHRGRATVQALQLITSRRAVGRPPFVVLENRPNVTTVEGAR